MCVSRYKDVTLLPVMSGLGGVDGASRLGTFILCSFSSSACCRTKSTLNQQSGGRAVSAVTSSEPGTEEEH